MALGLPCKCIGCPTRGGRLILAEEIGFGADGLPWNPANFEPLVINVALTGTQPQKRDNPNLPATPEEIASDVATCFEHGARVFHLHMRDSDGIPTQSKDIFSETISLIRGATPEAIICATTSARASTKDEERFYPLELLEDLRPDMASLSLGSFNFPSSISTNSPDMIRALLARMTLAGVLPELEVFEPGMVLMERRLRHEGLITGKAVFNILLGSMGTSPATISGVQSFLSVLPQDCHWSLAGIGRFQLPTMHWAIAGGGHVRVGLEDAPLGPRSEPWTNSQLVSRAAKIAESLDRPLASPYQARRALGLV
jgi:uncharacterized protein (DUF849 family)